MPMMPMKMTAKLYIIPVHGWYPNHIFRTCHIFYGSYLFRNVKRLNAIKNIFVFWQMPRRWKQWGRKAFSQTGGSYEQNAPLPFSLSQDSLKSAVYCMALAWSQCSVQHGIGHNSKYLGLPVDTGCHTKSWWTQGSHPHSFYTHPSTQVKSKMKTQKWEEKQL